MGEPESTDAGQADGIGRATSDCGDLVEMRIWVDGRLVERCDFRIEGCRNTLAVAAVAATWARGRSFGEILGLQAAELAGRVEGLPPGTEHVAELAVGALHEAVLDAVRTRQEPWKRAYRRS